MSHGTSGRIVVEVDPGLKKRLYAALSLDATTLKDWFVAQAEAYLASHDGLVLQPGEGSSPGFRKRRKG